MPRPPHRARSTAETGGLDGPRGLWTTSPAIDPQSPFIVAGGHPFAGDFPGATLVGGAAFFETSTGDADTIDLDRNTAVFADADGGDHLVITLLFAEFNDEDTGGT